MSLLAEMDMLEYGWKGMLIALVTCVVIGVIKTPVKAAIKRRTNEVSKAFGAVAFCLSAVLGAAGAVIFGVACNGFFDIASPKCWGFLLWVVSMTQFLYAMYEKLGFRETLKWFLGIFFPQFKELGGGEKAEEKDESNGETKGTSGTEDKGDTDKTGGA